MKKIYARNVHESYGKLLGPEANLYSTIDWAFDVEKYDFDRVRSDYTYEIDDSSVFSKIFAIKCGNDYFHPYCADKLGLNENDCNDTNSKGGEFMSEKSGMTGKAAARIQSHADKSGTNQSFKARAQSSAAKNEK